MRKNNYKGKLIAIDGPNGVGKSTVIAGVKEELEKRGKSVYVTKEPTESVLGKFVRSYAEVSSGETVACLVAADRYEHIYREIIPQLEGGRVVITDRYILSSLILQRMDAVSNEFILAINNDIILPDLQIGIFAESKIIRERLEQREVLTRFEKNEDNTELELKYLREGLKILGERDTKIIEICNNNNLHENIEYVVNQIEGV